MYCIHILLIILSAIAIVQTGILLIFHYRVMCEVSIQQSDFIMGTHIPVWQGEQALFYLLNKISLQFFS